MSSATVIALRFLIAWLPGSSPAVAVPCLPG